MDLGIVLVCMLFLAMFDVAITTRVYGTADHPLYWIFRYMVYLPICVVLTIWLDTRRALLGLLLVDYLAFGLEDTLYYLLQLTLPVRYKGISIGQIWEPHWSDVLKINVIGIVFMLILISLMQRRESKRFHSRSQSCVCAHQG